MKRNTQLRRKNPETGCTCDLPEVGRFDHGAFCPMNHNRIAEAAEKKRKAAWARQGKKPRRPLPKQSPKRAVAAKLYTSLRKTYMENHPSCQAGYSGICTRHATDVHHRAGRGRLLNAVDWWMACCQACHAEIHSHPREARRLGYLIDSKTLK